MKTGEIQAKGYIRVGGNGELDAIELAHVVSYLRDEFGSLMCGLRGVREELAD